MIKEEVLADFKKESRSVSTILDIKNLSLIAASPKGQKQLLFDVNLQMRKGSSLAIVGESGAGKSLSLLSILRLLDPKKMRYLNGSILCCGVQVLTCKKRELERLRAQKVGIVFQEPMSALNPLHRIGQQLIEPVILHQGLSKKQAKELGLQWLERVALDKPQLKWQSYPHQLSGGERQRVLIAMALIHKPDLLLLDEPTTALDTINQAQILQLLKRLQQELNLSMLFVSHNLNLVKDLAEEVVMMEKGRTIKKNFVKEIIFEQRNPTMTQTNLHHRTKRQPVLLEAQRLRVEFTDKPILLKTRKAFTAVKELSFQLHCGESFAFIGASGAGKSSAAMALLRLLPSNGRILFEGQDISHLQQQQLLTLRRKMQVVFQDPFSTLDPRMSVGEIVAEGLKVHQPKQSKQYYREKVATALEEVGLESAIEQRYPQHFSGGQRQRIALARALVLSPQLLLLDEPTSSLDQKAETRIVELLKRLQQQRNLAYIFITHKLSLARNLCQRVMIMQAGEIVEQGVTEHIFSNPKHSYTAQLIRSSQYV